MISLLKKEIGGFLSSLIGYIVITVFLMAMGLFLWVFPGNFNILDAGFASLETLFVFSPWIFMFLIPAITMRSFAEEKRTGTIELLLTRPLSEWQIIFAKYLAGLLLVIISVAPTVVYYFSLQALGNPPGNVDSGGTWGSYAGLIFLGGAFVSIGLFASSLSDNQIVSFILAFFLSFFCYAGFDSIAQMEVFSGAADVIFQLGISQHFDSMSRGVIDTRDVIYFLSFITFFLALTRFKLLSRTWS
jgi:ABC-2 type transport system permease protein